MKLWLLRPVGYETDKYGDQSNALPEGDDPWEPWYDKAFGFVVRAETEEEARQFAHGEAGDENRGKFAGTKISNTTTPWLDLRYSTCVELRSDGEAGVIVKDFAAA